MLQDQPHALHVVFGIAPVTTAGEVAEIELVLLALLDTSCCQRDLTCDEGLAATLALVVEENTVAGKHVISISILLHDPKAILLGHSIGRIGMERRVFILRHLFHLAIELGGGRLIDAATVREIQLSHSLQDAEHTDGIHVGGIFRGVEAYLYVALCSEVVDLCRTYFANHAEYTH